MRLSKRYLTFLILLVVGVLLQLNHWSDDYARVETFRGAQLEPEVFSPLIAKNANEERLLTVTVDGEEYTGSGFLVGNSLNLVALPHTLQEILDCSIKVQEDGSFSIEWNGFSTTGEELGISAEKQNGQFYIPAEEICGFCRCEYSWNQEKYRAKLTPYGERVSLPKNYDLRDYAQTPTIRDQGSDSTCWAIAALEAFESSLLPTQTHYFSESNMISSINPMGNGGNYAQALGYFLSWRGPFENGDVAAHLQEARFYDADDIDAIKRAVYQNGAVSTSIYVNVENSNISGSFYYNSNTNAYCCASDREPNHEVIIIGWDDNYDAAYFSSSVAGDGAFICQNSWGSDFGDNGVFYVSYYDSNIGKQAVSYCGIESTNNYDQIYQSDLTGWDGEQLGFGRETITAANVYTAKGNEKVEAAGFYALDKNTRYILYFVSDVKGTSDFARRQQVASGTLTDAGYYTISFETPQKISEGEKFAVILTITTPGSDHPMAIETDKDGADLTDGDGYISINGLEWEKTEEKAQANLCLKAYSKNVEE